MIPEFTNYDYIFISYSILLGFIVFAPSIPAAIIYAIKQKTLKTGFRFPLKACVISIGISTMIIGGIIIPLEGIKLFLMPIWISAGYEEFAWVFPGILNVFNSYCVLPIIFIVSTIVPFILLKYTKG